MVQGRTRLLARIIVFCLLVMSATVVMPVSQVFAEDGVVLPDPGTGTGF